MPRQPTVEAGYQHLIALCGQEAGGHGGGQGKPPVHQKNESACVTNYGNVGRSFRGGFQTGRAVLNHHVQFLGAYTGQFEAIA